MERTMPKGLNTKMDALWYEAFDRMELMGISLQDRNDALALRKVNFKVVVNDQEKSIRKMPVTREENKMIEEIENEYGVVCYYLIKDQCALPDGTVFNRYTLPYVSDNSKEYDGINEGIENYCALPVYVINVEIPEYSEFTECEYKSIKGLIINVS